MGKSGGGSHRPSASVAERKASGGDGGDTEYARGEYHAALARGQHGSAAGWAKYMGRADLVSEQLAIARSQAQSARGARVKADKMEQLAKAEKAHADMQGNNAGGKRKRASGKGSTPASASRLKGEVKLANGTYISRAEYEAAKQRAAYGGPVYRALLKNGSVEARSSEGTRFRIVQHANAFGLPAYDIIRHGETEPAAGYKGVIINRERLLDMTHGLTVARASRAKKVSA